MKKLIPLLVSSVMLVSVVGCQTADKTSAGAPDTVSGSPSPAASSAASPAMSSPSPAVSSAASPAMSSPSPAGDSATKNDAQNPIRQNQLNSDIRANEQRNNALSGGSTTNRSENALRSEVRDKLEANLPGSKLAVQAKEGGVITIAGTVPKQQDLTKIEPLAKQIKGVNKVTVKATAVQ